MSLIDLQQLPPEVQDVIFSDDITDQNLKLADTFGLSQSQLSFILDVEENIWIKKTAVLDLPTELEEMDQAEGLDIREIALEISLQVLWPLQEYLKDVDRLILRLGGKVPRMKRLRRAKAKSSVLPVMIKGVVKILLEQYSDLKDKRLSSKKILAKDGRRVLPSISNWIEDYIHFLGAGYHNSLQRSKYLAKSPNILDTDEDERETLRHFFTSYDDGVIVEIDGSTAVLKIKEVKEEKITAEIAKPKLQEVLDKIHKNILELDKSLVPENIILSETGNSLHKLRDVLWRALALQDKDKVIGCLRVLLNKKSLDLMVQEDRRFQGLLKRFVSIRYGEQSQFDYNNKLLLRRLFFELILVDKLGLSQLQATTAAYYLINLTPKSGQVVYLDTQEQELRWRDVHLMNNKVTFLK
ncbi:hypothetical protein HN670_01995 [bacterium]|jgi:hypothetical protein|nr:hypothetical protein [bacterium]